jgi:hypothetical protein
MTEYIDLTPTWTGLLPGLLAAYAHGTQPATRQLAYDELKRMARAADMAVAAQKKEKAT